MDQNPYTLCFEDASPNVVVAKLGGVLDLESASPLQRELTHIASHRSCDIVVDMSNVTFVSSTALGVLSALNKRMKARHTGRLRMAALSRPVEQVNRALCAHQTLEVFPSVREALAAV